MDERLVWVLVVDDCCDQHNDDHHIKGVFATREAARAAFKTYLDDTERGWKCDDYYGRSYDECLEQMIYERDNGGFDCFVIEEPLVA